MRIFEACLSSETLHTNKKIFFEQIDKWVSEAQPELASDIEYREVAAERMKKAYLSQSESLDLSNLNLRTLPDAIGNLGNLKKLILNGNRLSTLPETMWDLDDLQKLSLENNELRAVPDVVCSLINLQELNLSDNALTVLPHTVGQLNYLQKLVVSNNQLSALPEMMDSLINLRILAIDGNPLSTCFKRSDIGLPHLQSLIFTKEQAAAALKDHSHFLGEVGKLAAHVRHRLLFV